MSKIKSPNYTIRRHIGCHGCFIVLTYPSPEIAFSGSIFDFINVPDVNTDAELPRSLLNGFIFLNEPLHLDALANRSQDVGATTDNAKNAAP